MIVYALAVLSTIAATLYRPAHSALLPSLCRTGYELASANMVRGLLDSAATLVGPLVAAVLLQFTGVDVVFWVAAGASFVAAALLVRLRYDAPPRPPAPSRANLAREAVEGVRAVVQNRDLTLILGLAAAQALTRGALTVFSVVVAIELLDTGEPGVGALMAAVGVGAVLGSLAASLPSGRGGWAPGSPSGSASGGFRSPWSPSFPSSRRRWACWRSSASATPWSISPGSR